VELSEIHYGRETDRPWFKEGRRLTGYQAILTPTRATVVDRFDDGLPLVTEHRVGKGAAVMIATEVSLTCQRPGHTAIQEFAARHVLGGTPLPFECQGCIAYRLAGPRAEHYILVNDGAPKEVRLKTRAIREKGVDAVTGEAVRADAPIALPGWSARWVRFERGG
jgi:hypothetical protein